MQHTPLNDGTVHNPLIVEDAHGFDFLRRAGNALMYDHKGHAAREIDVRDDAKLSTADDTAYAIDDGLLADLFEADNLICQLQLDGVSFTDKHDAIALRNELVAHCGIACEDGLNDSGLGQCG